MLCAFPAREPRDIRCFQLLQRDGVRLHGHAQRFFVVVGEPEQPEEIRDLHTFDPDLILPAVAADDLGLFLDTGLRQQFIFHTVIKTRDRGE